AAKLFDFRDTIGLERLCRQLGVPHRRPHHALADAEATAGCFLELLRQARERFGWTTLGDLLEAGQPPLVRVVAPDDARGAAAADGAPRRSRRSRRGGRSAARRSDGEAPPAPPAETAD